MFELVTSPLLFFDSTIFHSKSWQETLPAVVLILETAHTRWLHGEKATGDNRLCLTVCHSRLTPASGHKCCIQPLSSLSSTEILPGLGVSRAARSGEESRVLGPRATYVQMGVTKQTTPVPGHSQEQLLCHGQQQEPSEEIKKNQIGNLWPMELIQGLLCGKTHPTLQERPGRQSGTDYSLCRDFIAGSYQNESFKYLFPSCFKLLS